MPTVLTRERVLDTAIGIGLDRFTVAAVARSLGVTDMAVYRYVRSRDDLYARAAARAFGLDPARVEGPDWRAALVALAEHGWRVARRHPGIEEYVLNGPYHAETLAQFDATTAAFSALEPSFTREECYLLLSRVTSLACAAAGNALANRYQESADRPGELFLWTVRALVDGMAGLVRDGDLPRNRAALVLGPESRVELSPPSPP